MSHKYQAPRPPMPPFALMLRWPSVVVGGDRLSIAWKGVGPFDIPLLVRGDGAVIFDFPAVDRFAGPPVSGYQPIGGQRVPANVTSAQNQRTVIAYARLQYMNAWLAGYMSAMSFIRKHAIITPPPVDPNNHLKAEIEDNYCVLFNNDMECVFNNSDSTEIDSNVLEYATDVMSKAHYKMGNNFLLTLSLFHQASYHYRIHQFDSAHIAAWVLCEQVLHAMWREYQSDVGRGENPITSIPKRRADLLNGRDYSASIVTQILSLSLVDCPIRNWKN